MRRPSDIKFVFFGSSELSQFVLEELRAAGLEPMLVITNARAPLPSLPEADAFVVASFGKILPQEVIDHPKHGSLNVHPSLLPKLRGPSPIQNMILQNEEPGVSIMLMDEKMDHGPILAQEKLRIEPWPDKYEVVEEKLARAGGKLLAQVLPKWVRGEVEEKEQDHERATYTKMIKKEDGLLDPTDSAEKNWRKTLAYSRWPGAFFYHKRGDGKEIRVVVKDARIADGEFVPTRVIPAGKKEMPWQSFLRGNL